MRNSRKRGTKRTIAIVGEGQTERAYFEQIRSTEKRLNFRISPDLPSHSDIKHIFSKSCEKIEDGIDIVFALIDMDIISKDSKKADQYNQLKKSAENKAKKKGTMFFAIESSPCTEFWFLMHFIFDKVRRHSDCKSVMNELKKHVPDYVKSEKFLCKFGGGIYQHLCEIADIKEVCEAGMKISEKRTDDCFSDINYSEIYKIFNLLREC